MVYCFTKYRAACGGTFIAVPFIKPFEILGHLNAVTVPCALPCVVKYYGCDHNRAFPKGSHYHPMYL